MWRAAEQAAAISIVQAINVSQIGVDRRIGRSLARAFNRCGDVPMPFHSTATVASSVRKGTQTA
jgi:hypothetical protein